MRLPACEDVVRHLGFTAFLKYFKIFERFFHVQHSFISSSHIFRFLWDKVFALVCGTDESKVRGNVI